MLAKFRTVIHPLESRLASRWPPSEWRDISILLAVSGGPDSVALLRGNAPPQDCRGRKAPGRPLQPPPPHGRVGPRRGIRGRVVRTTGNRAPRWGGRAVGDWRPPEARAWKRPPAGPATASFSTRPLGSGLATSSPPIPPTIRPRPSSIGSSAEPGWPGWREWPGFGLSAPPRR